MSDDRSDAVAGFIAAQAFSRDEVFGDPSPVPTKPGTHGWWFRALPAAIDTSGCEQRDGLTLLHVGASPGPPPASGRPPVSQDLSKRIRYHFGEGSADAQGSTLRKTLGVLLAHDLGIELRRIGSGKRRTFAAGEAILTRWMSENVVVSWVVRPEPWRLEDELVQTLDLPLNLNDKARNAFYPELAKARGDAEKKAARLRVLKEFN